MPHAFNKGMPGDATAPPVLTFACPACDKKLHAAAQPAARTVTCPGCGQAMTVPAVSAAQSRPAPARRVPLRAALVVTVIVVGCSIYANLSFLVRDPRNYRYFPPFEPRINANHNRELQTGTEYGNIARALLQGRGFADPFSRRSGPTAWMPPVLPLLLAGFFWISEGDGDVVLTVIVVLKDLVLIGTGLLVLGLAQQTMPRFGAGLAAAVFLLGVLSQFRFCFQWTHDCWLVLLVLDLVIAGFCWWTPLRNGKRAVVWGVLGGVCALSNPIVGLAWGLGSLLLGWRQRAWSRLSLALALAGLTVAPWLVRNALVFGRLIPVKSNLAYELWQSQCLGPSGVLHGFPGHPMAADNVERRDHARLGEIAYLDRKGELFRRAVQEDPLDFLERAGNRFLAATLVYTPFNRRDNERYPWRVGWTQVVYPLPFLGLILLLATAWWRPLVAAQWIVIGVYLAYLLPYVLISYYDRYKFPLIGAEAALLVWGIGRTHQILRDCLMHVRRFETQ
jgi:hypothetical protein